MDQGGERVVHAREDEPDAVGSTVRAPQAARAVDLQEARNDSVLHAYRSSLAFRKSHPALTQGATSFLDLPEPVLGIVRTQGGTVLTCLFNLGERPLTLTLSDPAQPVGPIHAEVDSLTVSLPAHGYVTLESTGSLDVTTDSAGRSAS